jgi:hypothetical protein
LPAPSAYPLRRLNINLYDADCREMERLYGRGWSEKVRALVREHVKARRKYFYEPEGGTLDG